MTSIDNTALGRLDKEGRLLNAVLKGDTTKPGRFGFRGDIALSASGGIQLSLVLTPRRADNRELARQGQVYFLHNRVQSIEKMRDRIAQLWATLHRQRLTTIIRPCISMSSIKGLKRWLLFIVAKCCKVIYRARLRVL